MINQISYLESLIRQHVDENSWQWLAEKAALVREEKNASTLISSFALIPRKTGSKKVEAMLSAETDAETGPGKLHIRGWTTDRLSRVWLIMQVNASGKTDYIEKLGNLFSGASMNEQVALYSALPVLAYPEEWILRCSEGVRSNIGTVLEAIMYENPYPFYFLDEAAFNQMLLKAFFTDKNVDRIIGLDQRANPALADVLFDYAHERWAAKRTVNPQLWRLTGKYINAVNFADIHRLWENGTEVERKAALLVCSQSDYEPAKSLWENGGTLKRDILENGLNWHNLNG